jgi:hypothetical protein
MQYINEQIRNKAGYSKIKRCCDVAADDGFDYVWIDTCCIDKTSSSELSEAINSMFKWYKQAEVCYVFLFDVPSSLDITAFGIALRNSRWFTRGWTLQELIAPACVIFFDNDWKESGTKSSLRGLICAITLIQVDVLLGHDIEKFSIAQRMSWASSRTTTIDEDIAYCLMGIFQVNMPLLYGEGGNAFMRLQEEIIRRSDDHSIFAWQDNLSSDMLARSPKSFQSSTDIVRVNSIPAEPFALTNKGVHLKLPLRRIPEEEEPGMYLMSALVNGSRTCKKEERKPNEHIAILYMAMLNCHRLGEPESLICVYLENVSTLSEARFDEANIPSLERETMRRLDHNLGTVQLHDRSSFQARSFYVRPYNRQLSSLERYPRNPLFIRIATLATKGLHLCESSPGISFNGIPELEEDTESESGIGLLRFRDPDGDEFVILLQVKGSAVDGYDRQLSAYVYLTSQEEDPKQPLWSFLEKAEIKEPSVVTDLLEPQGIIWKQPSGRSMNLVLRRQVLSGKRGILVDLNCERPKLYAKEGRKATMMVN